MSGMKNHFDNYMDMILSGGESNDDDSSSVLDDFDDVEEDEKLNVCREIFSAKYDLEDDEASNDSWRDKYDGDIDCDIDGDGEITAADLLAAEQIILNGDTDKVIDLNLDGIFNSADIVILQLLILGIGTV